MEDRVNCLLGTAGKCKKEILSVVGGGGQEGTVEHLEEGPDPSGPDIILLLRVGEGEEKRVVGYSKFCILGRSGRDKSVVA